MAGKTKPPQTYELKTQLFMGGQWVPAADNSDFDVIDPADGTRIASVADGSSVDAIKCVEAAHAAAPSWHNRAQRERADILMNCFNLMLKRQELLAELISIENGKAMGDARAEVRYAAEFCRWYAEESVRVLGQYGPAPSGNNHIAVQYRPMGIAVLITPWNFPAAMATRKIAPALAAGCTCVLKPAAETPLTALALAELMQEAGVPDGVLNVVTTTRAAEVVSVMLTDNRVRKLSFTGSTAVGRELLRQAASQVLSCSMELGGNAPLLVFDDADIELAVNEAMVAKMRNGGQACTAANRFLVQRGVYAEFTARLAQRMGNLKLGRGLESETDVGPLIANSAVRKVERLVNGALQDGARLVVGGPSKAAEGFFYEPTVLADVSSESAIFGEEIFGPVAAITPFDTEDEAVGLANATEYGLVAYVFSRDVGRALRIAGRVEAGMVGINRGVVSDAAAPFGGAKQSGIGREGGHLGLLEYLEPQYIAMNW